MTSPPQLWLAIFCIFINIRCFIIMIFPLFLMVSLARFLRHTHASRIYIFISLIAIHILLCSWLKWLKIYGFSALNCSMSQFWFILASQSTAKCVIFPDFNFSQPFSVFLIPKKNRCIKPTNTHQCVHGFYDFEFGKNVAMQKSESRTQMRMRVYNIHTWMR